MYQKRKIIIIIIILTYLHIMHLQSGINFLEMLRFSADLISYGKAFQIFDP